MVGSTSPASSHFMQCGVPPSPKWGRTEMKSSTVVIHFTVQSDLYLCTPLYLQYLYNCTPFQSTDPACTHFIFAIPLLLHAFWVHGGRAKIQFRLYCTLLHLATYLKCHPSPAAGQSVVRLQAVARGMCIGGPAKLHLRSVM
jgi:hypothetical protein